MHKTRLLTRYEIVQIVELSTSLAAAISHTNAFGEKLMCLQFSVD